jgi:hypothetical protein
MTQMTPGLRALARDLMASEIFELSSVLAGAEAIILVTERLRPALANLMGKGGFRALLARALVLASADVSWLNTVHVNADGRLAGFEAPDPNIGPAEQLEGRVVLLARLIGLLVVLIGPHLTARLLREIWPKLPSIILPSATSEVQNERAK